MQKFAVMALVAQSYRAVLDNLPLLSRAAGLWIAIAVINGGLMFAAIGHQPITAFDPETPPPAGFLFLSMVDSVIALLGITATVVFWHRYLLLGESNVRLAAPVNRKVFQYIWLGLVIGLMSVFPGVILMLVLGGNFASIAIVGVATLVLAALLWARLILVFPGTAIDDKRATFKESWEATQKFGGPILFGIVLTTLPFLMIGVVLGSLINAIGASVTLLAVLVEQILSYAQAAVFAGFMSFSFKALTKPSLSNGASS